MSAIRWSVALSVLCGVAACAALVARRGGNDTAQRKLTGPTPSSTSKPASGPSQAILTVVVRDLRNRKGDLIFGVFKTADGFPRVEKKSVNWQVKAIDGKTVTFTADLPPGKYAGSVLHDENGSGEMDFNFANIPTEGYGVTNNPKPAFRAATFKEATFTLPPEGASLTISVQYF